ncbi:MAG TPA: PSD1 and planctomycete cytochrome C domain-containing protein [Bryobacteraceae bacterium]|nr:PSD1 and planctomycete cytochrome C domain-containing protein [Bryobacteraceae bacterium]
MRWIVLSLAGLACVPTKLPGYGQPGFENSIAPLLEARCLKCHSGSAPAGGLDIRSRDSLVKGGNSGPAVVPGTSAKSNLLVRLRNGQMPPGGPPLAPVEIELIRSWIDAGAVASDPAGTAEPGTRPRDRDHWAFRKPLRPAAPHVAKSSRVRTPVDAFILAALEHKKLDFSPDAGRITLMRRAYFDLIGLPPAPEEVEEFLADRRADAYERLIDRLLASPRYGERWARHWLDIAGYADSEGGEAADVIRPNAWRYRDYVIRAFNSDKPYDLFLREQLAGDELSEYWKYDQPPAPAVERLEATGFLRTAVDGSLDSHPRELNLDYLWKALFDTEQIVASSTLGLTLQCARCHDHKYEPVSQKDYYRLQALFLGGSRPDGPFLVAAARNVVEASKAEKERAQATNKVQDPVIKALQQLLKARAGQYRAHHPKGEQATEAELKEHFQEYAVLAEGLEKDIREEEARRVQLPSIRAFYDVDAKPPAAHVLSRGDYAAQRGEAVQPGVPSVLDDPSKPFRVPEPASGAPSTGRRLAFAKWLTQPGHPLTARVMVNRIWTHHFGAGIVRTTDNFGRSGEPPVNPALLDWLATEFVEHGWSVKAMQRLIMTSTTYRQSSAVRPAAAALDPENRLLWRMNARRLEAEVLRDTILAVSGTLDLKMYGEPVKSETKPSGEIVTENDNAGGRRSVYLLVRRSAPQTFLNALGAPVMEINCTRRSTYNSPLQALNLLNGEFSTAQAKRFAQRLLENSDAPSRLERAFLLAFGRRPLAAESAMLLKFAAKQQEHYAALDAAGRDLQVWADICQTLLASNEFLYVD